MRVDKLLLGCAVIALIAFGCGEDDEASQRAPLSADPPLVIGAAAGRPANVVLPDDYDVGKTYPLVVLLHGFGATAQAQDLIFRLTMRTASFQFILVLPDGTTNAQGSRFWDATPECCNFAGPPVDDVGYLASLMKEAMEIYAVDRNRIRLVGHSNGGYMAYRYACEHPVAVDRIAVLAGSTFIEPEACKDPRPIDVLHMHGTLDETILYAPNLPPDGDPSKVPTIGAEAAVARWAARDGCAEGLELIERRDYHLRPRPGDDPAETEILRAHDCRSGHSVELWRSNGADHLFFTGNDTWRDALATFLSE
jgi:polyhydroxybutyrate depolymerase